MGERSVSSGQIYTLRQPFLAVYGDAHQHGIIYVPAGAVFRVVDCSQHGPLFSVVESDGRTLQMFAQDIFDRADLTGSTESAALARCA